jgi:hypothetical protein
VAEAESCSVAPATSDPEGAETAIACSVFGGAVTVRTAEADLPERLAVRVEVPGVTAVAKPAALTVATAVAELVQVTDAVTSALEPSLYWAPAVKAWVAPTSTLAEGGAMLIDVSVFGGWGTLICVLPLIPP